MDRPVFVAAVPWPRTASLVRHVPWAFPILACLVALTLFWPRFAVHQPSLVDDWFAITYSPAAVRGILHGDFDSSVVDYGARFRPAYFLWEYFRWHAVGSPARTLVPTLLAFASLLAFMATVACLVVVVTRRAASRAWVIALAALAPTLIILTPLIPYNFVRFNGSRAIEIVTLTAGLILITRSARALITSPKGSTKARAVAAFCVGYLLYLFGVYTLEASVAVVALLPALYLWLADDSSVSVGRRRLWRSKTVLLSTVLLLAPVLQIVATLLSGVEASDKGEASAGGLGATLVKPAAGTLIDMVFTSGSPLWFAVFVAVVVAGVKGVRARDREATLYLGIVSAGALSTYLSHFAASGLSRYLIPWLVGVAVGGAALLLRLEPRVRALVLALAAVALVVGNPYAHVRWWMAGEFNGNEALTLAKSAQMTGCPVYLAGFPGERRTGLPRLLRWTDATGQPALRHCDARSTRAYALTWSFESRSEPPRGCRSRWSLLERRRDIGLYACSVYREPPGTPTQDVGIEAAVRVVRLVEPTTLIPASDLHSE